MDNVIKELKSANAWDLKAVFVAYTDSMFIYKADLDDGSFWGIEIINGYATLLSEMLVSELICEYGNSYIAVQHWSSDDEALSKSITHNEFDDEISVDIETAILPMRNKLKKDEEGTLHCEILDMELDPLKCTFENDLCVKIDTSELDYVVLSIDNLKVLNRLIELADLDYNSK